MENRSLRLPRVEPLLLVPMSSIVEFVSNRREVKKAGTQPNRPKTAGVSRTATAPVDGHDT